MTKLINYEVQGDGEVFANFLSNSKFWLTATTQDIKHFLIKEYYKYELKDFNHVKHWFKKVNNVKNFVAVKKEILHVR